MNQLRIQNEMSIEMKRCTGNQKLDIEPHLASIDKFSSNGKDKNGKPILRSQCKTCRNPPKVKPVETERKCTKMDKIIGCGEIKPIEEFPITGKSNKNGTVHRRYICKVCYNKSRRKKEKEPILMSVVPKKHQITYSKVVSELIKIKIVSLEYIFQQCRGNFCNNSVKSINEFAKDGKGGYKPMCKPCLNKTKVKHYDGVILKICETCENICRPELLNDDLFPSILCLICNPRPIVEVTDPNLKQCLGICGKILPKEEMIEHSSGAKANLIYRNLCKECDKYNRRKDKYLFRNSDRLEVENLLYKHCKKCDEWLDEEDFYKSSKNADELNDLCISCYKKKQEWYRENNREAYRLQTNKRIQERFKIDLAFKMKHNNRKRVHDLLTGKRKSTDEYIGCNSQEFEKHIISQFREGMSLDNYGNKRTDWVVDHIIPLSSFDMTIEEEAKKAFHYSNCQPLWFVENAFKSNKTNLKPEDYMKGRYHQF